MSQAAPLPTDRTDKNFDFAKAIMPAPNPFKECLMFISAARRKLQSAIDAATDPVVIAQLTTALSRLIDAEGRERGRRQRQKLRAEQASPENHPPTFDPDAPFDQLD